jgi:uncharacterized membrane protein
MRTTPNTHRTPSGLVRPFLVSLFVAALLLIFSPPAFAGITSRAAWAPVEWAMGSQRRMLQVGTVGMCLALYIIMWRK